MIVRPVKNGVRLVTQHDHARAAGTLARNWIGNEIIAPPSENVKEAIFFAVDNHDVGWCHLDESPALDPLTKLPRSFFGATADEATEIWSKSISFCESFHPLSGFLVSAHFFQLANSGIRGAPAREMDCLKKFVKEEKNRREYLHPLLSVLEEAVLEDAVLLLRTCDTLSLFACRAPEVIPSESRVHHLVNFGLKVRFQENDLLEITPWPFRSDCLVVKFPGVTVPGHRFESSEEFLKAFKLAEPGVFVTECVPLK